MTVLNLSSEITVSEVPPKTRVIDGILTSILLAAGVTERGPHEATKVSSFEEYLNVFGGDTLNSDLTHAVRGYFDEGGLAAWVKRIVHYTDINDPLTKGSAKGSTTLQSAVSAPGVASVVGTIAGPWELAPGDTLKFDVDGAAPPLDEATFDAAAAVVTGTETDPFTLTNGMTLLLEIDNGSEQTITFLTSEFTDIGNATAEEVAAVINAKIVGAQASVSADAVRITSDKQGTDSRVQVTGGTSATELGLAAADNTGTGDVADITAVTAAEATLVIEADVAGVTVTEEAGGQLRVSTTLPGASKSIQIDATSEADTKFGFDNAVHSGDSGAAVDALDVEGKTDGSYTDDLRVIISAATSGVSTEFNLEVELDGVIVETWPNLSMTPTDDRFAETIINATNGSDLIVVDEPTTPLGKRPADGTSAYLTGGNDGLSGLVDNDFIGSAAGGTGLRGFDLVEEGSLLAVPGRATGPMHLAMLTYAEDIREGRLFAIVDPPEGLTAQEMVDYAETTAGIVGLSEYGATYYPNVKVLNPDTAVFGDDETVTVPPSGHIAGMFARNDASKPGGVYEPPAGVDFGRFRTVVGLETEDTKDKNKRNLLYPKRINPISIVGGRPTIDGVRTLRGDSNFPTVAERRGVIFIEYSLKAGLQFARFRNNDLKLRGEVRRAIVTFLTTQMRQGAFRSQNPSEAFTVDTSDQLNPEALRFQGKLRVRIGLATQKPAEFINLEFTQDTRALDAAAAAAEA